MVVTDLSLLAKGYMDRIIPFTRAWWVDVVIVVGILGLIWLGCRRMESRYRPIILSFIFLHPIVLLAFTYLARPVWINRTLIWIMVPTLIAIGFAVSRLRGPRLVLATAALLVIPILGTVGYHLGFEKTAWDEGAAVVAGEASPEDLIFVMSPNNIIPFDRYFDAYGIEADRVGIPWDLPDREQPGMVLRPNDFDIIVDMIEGRERVWLVLNRAVLVTNNEDVDPVLRANFPFVEEHVFNDLSVIEYSLSQ
jgi:hypothetical protein